MGEIFAYSLVSGLLLLAMYPVYKWLMAGERQHGFNRGLLWAIYLAALLLPLAVPSLRELAERLTAHGAGEAQGGLITAGVPEVSQAETDQSLLPRILLWGYVAGIVATLGYTVMTALRLRLIIAEGEKRPCGGYTLVLTDREEIAPFSWMRYIVMSRSDYESSGGVIVAHETRHLELGHWVDMVMVQGVAVFMWYNPAAWLMREELKAVHEYQADEAVMTSGANLRDYQMLLVKKAVGTRFPSLANSLNHSKLKKRITMMHKNRSNVVRRMWALALLPAAAVAIGVAGTPAVSSMLAEASAATLGAQSADKVTEKSETVQPAGNVAPVYYVNGVRQPDDWNLNSLDPSEIQSVKVNKTESGPELYIELKKEGETSQKNLKDLKISDAKPEVLPEFPGGIDALVVWLGENIKYPAEAEKAKEEGRVVVRFIVTTDGRVVEPEIVRSVSPSLDAEALRVVSEMPSWKPGSNAGKPVACHYVLPVNFSLK